MKTSKKIWQILLIIGATIILITESRMSYKAFRDYLPEGDPICLSFSVLFFGLSAFFLYFVISGTRKLIRHWNE